MDKELEKLFIKTRIKYPFITKENFYRILFLYFGVDYKSQQSFPDNITRIESIFSISKSSFPVLVFLNPQSPFKLVDSGTTNHKVILYKNKYFDETFDYEQTLFNLKMCEPFHFFTKELGNKIVLKLNPIQLCDFYKNKNEKPCSFCFRNDMIKRFKNTGSKLLIKSILKNDKEKLKQIDELSIITGTYDNDSQYLNEITDLIKGLKKFISKNCRIVVGSHEAKTKKHYEVLKKSGVNVFTFSIESLDNNIRKKLMQNRKGNIPVEFVLQNIKDAIEVFGEENVIVRLVAGLGDDLNTNFIKYVKQISKFSKHNIGPVWNIDIYMPLTHFQFEMFKKRPIIDLEYLFNYCSIINQFANGHFLKFKISP
jgi:hypothetical protein